MKINNVLNIIIDDIIFILNLKIVNVSFVFYSNTNDIITALSLFL